MTYWLILHQLPKTQASNSKKSVLMIDGHIYDKFCMDRKQIKATSSTLTAILVWGGHVGIAIATGIYMYVYGMMATCWISSYTTSIRQHIIFIIHELIMWI